MWGSSNSISIHELCHTQKRYKTLIQTSSLLEQKKSKHKFISKYKIHDIHYIKSYNLSLNLLVISLKNCKIILFMIILSVIKWQNKNCLRGGNATCHKFMSVFIQVKYCTHKISDYHPIRITFIKNKTPETCGWHHHPTPDHRLFFLISHQQTL